MPADPIIHVAGLEKAYGTHRVLEGIDLEVERGTIFGLLGPNGAGKTTVVSILTTLVSADAGRATIAGYDLFTQPAQVRASISLTGQNAAVDEFLTGEENVRMMGHLLHLDARSVRRRSADLLDQFDLTAVRNKKVSTYSGGMRRRLDLAMSLIGRPPVIFLDEPTTGLDPRSRQALWDVVRELADDGVTIFLTTQYLEEADQLADRIGVVDRGTIIAEGSADELKQGLSGERIELRFGDAQAFAAADDIITPALGPDVVRAPELLTLSVGATDTVAMVKSLFDLLCEHRTPIAGIEIVRPSLDDVFFALTGHTAVEADTSDDQRSDDEPNGDRPSDDRRTEVAA